MNAVHQHPHWQAVKERNRENQIQSDLHSFGPRQIERLSASITFLFWLSGHRAKPGMVIWGAWVILGFCLRDASFAAVTARGIAETLADLWLKWQERWLRKMAGVSGT